MSKLSETLAEIKRLRASLKKLELKSSDESDLRWWATLELSLHLKQAGDLYFVEEENPLMAVKFYFDSSSCHLLNEVGDKLNILLQKDSQSNTFNDTNDNNDAEHLFLLGLQAQAGLGVPINYVAARHYFQRSAALGHLEAKFFLAKVYYFLSDEVQENNGRERAYELFFAAAQMGHAVAHTFLGKMAYHGDLEPRKFTQAISWWRIAADLGDFTAKSNLDTLYSERKGPTDPEQAKLYRKDLQKYRSYSRIIVSAMKMLDRCREANPNNISCEYHFLLANIEIKNISFEHYHALEALYQSYQDQFVDELLEDDLIDNELRKNLLKHLYFYSKLKAIPIPEKLLVYLGDDIFENLPKQDIDPETQSEYAMLAIEYYEQIPENSPHYQKAADAIVLMRDQFQSKDILSLYDEYFTSRNKLSIMDDDIAYVEKYNDSSYRQALWEYCKYPPSDADQHRSVMKRLFEGENNTKKLFVALCALDIKPEDKVAKVAFKKILSVLSNKQLSDYLNRIIERQVNTVPLVAHGLFTNQLPEKFRKIKRIMHHIQTSQCTLQDGLHDLICAASGISHIHAVAKECFNRHMSRNYFIGMEMNSAQHYRHAC